MIFFPSFQKGAWMIKSNPMWIFKKPLWELGMEKNWLESWPKKRERLCLDEAPRTWSMFCVNKGTPWTRVCLGLEGTAQRMWLLTRVTFLCGFNSFGLWNVVAMGAVETCQWFSLQFLPGPLKSTLPWAPQTESYGPLPAFVEELQFLIQVTVGLVPFGEWWSSPSLWTCHPLSSTRSTKHHQLQRGQCRWEPGTLG